MLFSFQFLFLVFFRSFFRARFVSVMRRLNVIGVVAFGDWLGDLVGKDLGDSVFRGIRISLKAD
jgi:hypothetical protein